MKRQVTKKGRLKFPRIIYYTYNILKDNGKIKREIADKCGFR